MFLHVLNVMQLFTTSKNLLVLKMLFFDVYLFFKHLSSATDQYNTIYVYDCKE